MKKHKDTICINGMQLIWVSISFQGNSYLQQYSCDCVTESKSNAPNQLHLFYIQKKLRQMIALMVI